MTDTHPPAPPAPAPAAVARAIVLVPGFQRAERFNRRDALVRGLCAQERRRFQPGSEVSVDGEVGVRLLPTAPAAGDGEIHVFEAYWADMFAEVAAPSPWARLVQGLGLVAYWMNVRMIRALRVSRYMTFGLVCGGLVLVLWYVSTFMLAAQAIASDKTLTPEAYPVWLREGVIWVADWIGGWKLWAAVTLLLPFLRADDVARLAAFARRYLENRPGDAELGLRDRVRQRVLATIDHVVDAGYREVLVVAHSFGTIVTSDIFADRQPVAGGPRLLLVTWGSPAAVMRYRSSWLHGEIEALLASTGLARWTDLWSKHDWLCSGYPGRQRCRVPGGSQRIDFDAPFFERLIGRTHVAYYTEPRALAPLLEAAPAGNATGT